MKTWAKQRRPNVSFGKERRSCYMLKRPRRRTCQAQTQKRPACQTLSDALDISFVTVWVVPDLSGTTTRISAADWEDLELYWQ